MAERRKLSGARFDRAYVSPPPAEIKWLSGEDLRLMGWRQAPIDALVPDVLDTGLVRYHRGQVCAVLADPVLGPRVGKGEFAKYFKSAEARRRIRSLQERNLPQARRDTPGAAHRRRRQQPQPVKTASGRSRQTFLLPARPSELGQQWLTAEMLVAAGWSPHAVDALVPENVYFPGGRDGADWELLHHRRQANAVRESPRLRHAIGADDSGFWRDRTVREHVRSLQYRSRQGAQHNADAVDAYLRSRRALLKPRSSQRTAVRSTAAPTQSAAPRHQTPKPPIPTDVAGVHFGYPIDFGPDPRTHKPEPAAPAPDATALPLQKKPMSDTDRSRVYRQLVETAQNKLAKARGRRRKASDAPVRITEARRAVILRSNGRCENPQCANPGEPGDVSDAGDPLLDVDHIGGLAATGDDEAVDMIALCPNCHRIKTLGRTRHELIPLLRETARRRHTDMLRFG
ncbi:HNH endonuclease signature motif containing protein [Streptomyces filamentosus]|uniref:HNH endonuclease signature motif containing protein n=1 Tax=Streptomyces filamentosus TaxID=67294 RepID=UPI0033DB14FA